MAKKPKKKINLDKPEYYLNRELSWLQFNKRVLELAQRENQPLLERLKFLAIFSSNLDEFFMIRVAGLTQQVDAGLRKKEKSGLTPRQQLDEISVRTHELVEQHTQSVKELIEQLKTPGLHILRRDEWTLEQRRYIKQYFQHEVLPGLTPLAVEKLSPSPLLPGLQLNVALTLGADEKDSETGRLLIVPVPGLFDRFLTVPSREGTFLVSIEDMIAENAVMLSRDRAVESVDFFRLTRDADVGIQEDEAADLLNVMAAAVTERRRRSAKRTARTSRAARPLTLRRPPARSSRCCRNAARLPVRKIGR